MSLLRLAGVAALALLAGCASASERMAQLPPPPTGVPDLRGTWRGTWDGNPITLVVTEQQEMAAYSGIYLGPVQLLGRRAPSVSGILTSTIRDEPVSTSVHGWMGEMNGVLTLVVRGVMRAGSQELTLHVGPASLAGAGQSTFPGGPQGPVELIRDGRP